MKPAGEKSRPLFVLAVCALALVVGTIVYLARSAPLVSVRKRVAQGEERRPETARGAESANVPAALPANPLEQLAQFCERLRRGEVDADALAAFRRELLSSEPRATIAAIRDFLATGKDSATGQRFTIVSGGGELEAAPTFRVWLLDVLGAIDRAAGTGEGAVISRLILDARSSADEWALALRNVAWGDPQAAPFLAGKFREMLAHEPWLAAPSAGFLEAFDTAVFVRDASLVPLLGQLVQGNRRELQRAAGMTLDRMAEADPLAVMNYLNSHPDAFAKRPLLRADYFAKADLAQAPQRAMLETYLARADVLLPEKIKLIKALAAPASFVSDTLFATPGPLADDTARSAALEQTVAAWTGSRRFPELTPALVELQERIRAR